MYSKRPPQSHSFNAKISLKNGPPWAKIFDVAWFDVRVIFKKIFAKYHSIVKDSADERKDKLKISCVKLKLA